MDSFDPYHQWLGIRPHEHPVDHYRLLGIGRFEDDAEVIRAAADRLMAHVRKFQVGQRSQYTQKLLNELSAAKICLLDARTKATYDAVLHGQVAAQPSTAATAADAGGVAPPPLSVPPQGPPPVSPPVEHAPPAPPATSPVHVTEYDVEEEEPPFYLAPWFPVVVVTALLLVAVSVWGVGRVMHKARQPQPTAKTPAVEPPPQTTPEPQPPAGVVIQQDADGELLFAAAEATMHGDAPRLEAQEGRQVITNVTSADDYLSWRFRIRRGGPFRIVATYAAPPGTEGGTFRLAVGDSETKSIRVRNTGETFTTERVGFLWIRRSGTHTLLLRPVSTNSGQSLMTLDNLRLVPARGSS